LIQVRQGSSNRRVFSYDRYLHTIVDLVVPVDDRTPPKDYTLVIRLGCTSRLA
jgi:hypothetical protein